MVSGFSWLAKKIKIIQERGIRLIVVKLEIVEIFYLLIWRKYLGYANNRFCCKTDGIKSACGDISSYSCVIEFIIQFLLPYIKCKLVEANNHEECEVWESGSTDEKICCCKSIVE